jgi:hypothetical protein
MIYRLTNRRRPPGLGPAGRRFKSNHLYHAIPLFLIGLHCNCMKFCNMRNLSDLSNSLSNDLTSGQGIRYSRCRVLGARLPRERRISDSLRHWFESSPANKSSFSFHHFPKPCNHPNSYRTGYSRTWRLKTPTRSHDGTGMSIVSGLRLNASRVDAKRGNHFLQTRLIVQ